MRNAICTVLVVVLAIAAAATAANAGAKLKINDDSTIDLGFRVQYLNLVSQADLDGDGKFESTTDYKVRRARFRLKGVINKYAEGFLQTDVSSAAGGSGRDMRVIDAWINMKANQWAQFIGGINMVPASRQNLTSSGALMAIDRPGQAYKSMSWGTRALYAFSNSTYSASDGTLRGEEDVRDAGLTLFGSGKVNDDVSVKYYAGVWDGIQRADTDKQRLAGRVQLNVFDPEAGYYNLSTYLGKKKTIGVGVSYDMQKSVAADSNGVSVDYAFFSGDVFVEWPVADGSLSLEGGISMLDLGDQVIGTKDLRQTNGTGFYGQAGYLVMDQWQPWVEFEQWKSDADMDLGSYKIIRAGINYYISGHNANIKAGFESFSPDVDLTMEESSITSFVLGGYLTY